MDLELTGRLKLSMSKTFDKSRLRSNIKYFEEKNSFKKNLNHYSLLDKGFHHASKRKTFEHGGLGGIPLFWSNEERKVYIDQTDSHSLVFGSTGSKKSRLVAMPMVMLLGDANESMIISDPKAEIYSRTAGALMKKGYDVSVINLRAPEYGDCWNPLSIPYQFYVNNDMNRAYEFVNDISENLTKLDASTKEPFWDNSAGSLFFGLALLLFKYCKEYNQPCDSVNIGNLINLRNTLFDSLRLQKKTSNLWNYGKRDMHIRSALIGTMEAANNTRASILSVFDEKMSNFLIKPSLMQMMSNSTVPLDTIDNKPTAVFLIMPDEKTSHHKLVSLFIKQSYEYLIYRAQKDVEDKSITTGKMDIRVNYILDEFSSLPTIKDFPAMITAARSRNIRFNMFVQSKNQLVQRYNNEAETIQSNCNNLMFLTSRELLLLREISSLCGNTDTERINKPVLSVAELQRLDKHKGEALILSGRNKPFLTNLLDIDSYNYKYESPALMYKRNENSEEYLVFELESDTDEISDTNERDEKRKEELARFKKWIEERKANVKETEVSINEEEDEFDMSDVTMVKINERFKKKVTKN